MTTPGKNKVDRSEYRADIDGLRAIAVISVLIYHAFPIYLGGGFVGVDIFFVISGFLISSLIIGELNQRRFSLRTFYVRRIRRIFPALATVLVASFIAGWALLLPHEFEQLGIQIFGGAAFVSNFLFWNESGYFDSLAETKPLLHLWSLGVEEQFYILFPLVLMMSWRWGFRSVVVVLAIGSISFLLNIMTVEDHPDTAFYLLHTRVWELMLGVLLAYWKFLPEPSWEKHGVAGRVQGIVTWNGKLTALYWNGLAWFGMYLIFAAFFLIDDKSTFPGYLALLPCVGTVLIIFTGNKAWLNRVLLSNRALVGIGLISYPLYLWHWPLLTFPRIIEGHELNDSIKWVLLIISFVLAWLTYVFVEKPFRFGRSHRRKTNLLISTMIAVCFAGVFVVVNSGLPGRSASKAFSAIEGNVGYNLSYQYIKKNFHDCSAGNVYQGPSILRCGQSNPTEPVSVALVGDSHAQHLFVGIAELLSSRNIAFYMHRGLPLEGNDNYSGTVDYIVQSDELEFVILAASWGRGEETTLGGLRSIVERITSSGKQVILTDDVPFFRYDAEACKYVRRLRQQSRCTESKAESLFYRRYEKYAPVLSELAKSSPSIKLVETSNYLCDEKACSMQIEGKLMYRDEHHLNTIGSQYVGSRMMRENPTLFEEQILVRKLLDD